MTTLRSMAGACALGAALLLGQAAFAADPIKIGLSACR